MQEEHLVELQHSTVQIIHADDQWILIASWKITSVVLEVFLVASIIVSASVVIYILDVFKFPITGEYRPFRYLFFTILETLAGAYAVYMLLNLLINIWREHRLRSIVFNYSSGALTLCYRNLHCAIIKRMDIEGVALVKDSYPNPARLMIVHSNGMSRELLRSSWSRKSRFESDNQTSHLGKALARALHVDFSDESAK